MRTVVALALLLVLHLVGGALGQAEELPAPAGEVILTVGGDIARVNRGDLAVFDRPMLEALGVATLRTSTFWTEGVVEFEGVPARRVLEAVGAEGEAVLATALNDYRVRIPVSDFRDYPVLLALRMNGRDLTLRDKGPIWIVYPRDDFPELQSEAANSRWVWQLSRLDVQ